jgi:hypothetical protein
MRCALAATELVSALLVSGCEGSGKRETTALLDAVDRYRLANTAAKADRAAAVGRLDCTEAAVCEAKRACVAGVEATTRAMQLKDEVTARLADLEQHRLLPDAPEAEALPGKLDEAGRLLQVGRDKMGDCERMIAELRLHYGS